MTQDATSTAPTAAPRASRIEAVLPLVVLVLLAATITWVVAPGRMSNDTLAQLSSVRSGEYSDWHAGLLIVLWRPFWLLGFGPVWVTAAGAACFVLGLYGTARLALGRIAALLTAVATTVSPMVLGYVGYLGRDLWFLAFLLGSIACIGYADRRRGRLRVAGAVAALALLWLMLASRQNAIAPAGVLLFGALATWRRPRYRPRHGSGAASWRVWAQRTVATFAVAAVVLTVLFASQVAARRVFDVERTHPEQAVYQYDLAALSVRQRSLLLSPANVPSQDLARIDELFDPYNVNPLLFGPEAPIVFPVSGPAFEELRADWRDAVLGDPGGYLAIKWKMWLEQIGVTGPTQWVYHPVIDPNPWGYAPVNAGADAALNRYLVRFAANPQLTGGAVHTVWVYLLVTAAGIGYLADRRSGRRLLAWTCVALWAYQATIFIGAMGVGYRFQLPAVVVALVVAAAALADVVAVGRRRLRRSA